MRIEYAFDDTADGMSMLIMNDGTILIVPTCQIDALAASDGYVPNENSTSSDFLIRSQTELPTKHTDCMMMLEAEYRRYLLATPLPDGWLLQRGRNYDWVLTDKPNEAVMRWKEQCFKKTCRLTILRDNVTKAEIASQRLRMEKFIYEHFPFIAGKPKVSKRIIGILLSAYRTQTGADTDKLAELFGISQDELEQFCAETNI